MSQPPSRPTRRGVLPVLRNVRLRSKLGLILLIPLLAVVTLSVVNLVNAERNAAAARHLHAVAKLTQAASNLVFELQRERVAAASLLNSAHNDPSGYEHQWIATDRVADTYRANSDAVRGISPDLDTQLKRLGRELSQLSTLRSDVLQRTQVTAFDVTFHYQVFIGDLLAVRDNASQVVGATGRLADEIRAAALISRAKEYAAREQAIVLDAMTAPHGLTPPNYRRFLSTLVGQQDALQSFAENADPDEQKQLGQHVGGDAVVTSRVLELRIEQLGPGARIRVPEKTWVNAMTARIDGERAVERRMDAQIVGLAQRQLDNVRFQALVESLIVLAVLLLAILLTAGVARSMSRSLGQLRTGALTAAYRRLPAAIEQFRTAERPDELSPETAAAQAGDAVPGAGRDEFGEVARAFNVVHREAVRLSVEQAVLRASVATMFVNLARRSQRLVDRLIGELDDMERREQEPDRLGRLFRLDHLATQMRRNDNSVLVLAGSAGSRTKRRAAELGDVLRAAQAEVEQYTRIEFGVVDHQVQITGTAVDDLVHLLAELLDNATTFSAPQTAVTVDGLRLGDRAVVHIEDRGIGMSAEQLAAANERLTSPPEIDAATSRMMGLVVVSQLARRLGIHAELRAGTDRGTIADVFLPVGILVPRHALVSSRNDTTPVGTDMDRASFATAPGTATPGMTPRTGGPSWFRAEAPAHRTGTPARSDTGGGDPLSAWHSSADPGWRAAASVADALAADTGTTGLPRRQPMRHLIPGAIQPTGGGSADPSSTRSPEAVRSLLGAYHRGVERGRRGDRPAPGGS